MVSAQAKKSHNDSCRAKAQYYESQGRQYDEAHAQAQAKLKRLKEAKSKLNTQLTKYKKFEEAVQKNCQQKVSDKSFKGDRRDKFDRKVKDVLSAISQDINHHQSNMASLNLKITSVALEANDLGTAAASAWDMAKSWLESLI